MKAALEPYRKLVTELKDGLRHLESLYGRRNEIREDIEAIKSTRNELADKIFDSLGNSEQVSKLGTRIDLEDEKLKPLEAAALGLEKRVLAAEEDLHKQVPEACFTFTRLLGTLRQITLDNARSKISALCKEPDNFKAEIEVLAQGSIEFQEICEIQVPSGGNWMLIRPLDKDRQETMDFVVHTGLALTDSADEVLAELDKLPNPEVPEFVLGELPKPPEPAVAPEPFEPDSWSSAEVEFIRLSCSRKCRTTRGDKSPIGQFISRLILACPPELWEEVRAQMDVKYDDWSTAAKRRARPNASHAYTLRTYYRLGGASLMDWPSRTKSSSIFPQSKSSSVEALPVTDQSNSRCWRQAPLPTPILNPR